MSNQLSPLFWRGANFQFDLTTRTLVMGILNVTPDSFSDGGQFYDARRAVDHALRMQDDGADIIDIGGESTRPGAEPVSLEEELARVLPIIEKLQAKLAIPISVDTYKAAVAEKALATGAVIVNDISACRFDADMPGIVARADAGLVLMHIKGEPRNMQVNPHYDDLIGEIMAYLQNSIDRTCAAGVPFENIAIDPGIGFGKRFKHNFQILKEIFILAPLNRPILVGPSRKSFIGGLLDLPAEQRLEGTLAAVTAAVLHGAHIVRVHDVKETKRAITVADAIIGKISLGD